MNNNLLFLPACLTQSILLCAGQVLMKKALTVMEAFNWSFQWWRDLFTNWWWAGTGMCFGAASLLWMWIVKHYPLSMAYPMLSLSYVFGMLAAIMVFHEAVPMRRWIGVFFIMLGCILIAAPANAQNRKAMASAGQQELVTRISKAGAQIKTLQCSFIQTKTIAMMNDKLISRGTMTYATGAKLRWQYTSPTSYTFIINGNDVSIDSGGGTSRIDARQSKMLQQIIRLMMEGVTGECLTRSKDFKVECFTDGGDDVAVLAPQDKNLRKMFATIAIHVSKGKDVVRQVVMTEPGGDKTVIELQDVILNKNVEADAFTLN